MGQQGERKWNFGQGGRGGGGGGGGGGRGGGGCQYTRPQGGHYQPRPSRQQQPERSMFEKDLIDERPEWILSVYGEGSQPRLFGFDTSFEEVRLHEMTRLRSGMPKNQVIAETAGFQQQALNTIEGFLDHRRRIEGGPQQQQASPRGKWNFGAPPRGGNFQQNHHFPQGNISNAFYNNGPSRPRGPPPPYASPPHSPSPYSSPRRDGPYQGHHHQQHQRFGGHSGGGMGQGGRPPYASPDQSPARSVVQPPNFKSSLFGASPSAEEAFSKPPMKEGVEVGTGNVAGKEETEMDSKSTVETMNSTPQGEDNENPWLASEFKHKIPEEPPPPEYIKPV